MSKNRIAYVNLGDGYLDNEYTIYDDGSVFHEWDQHPTKAGLTEEMTVSEIGDHRLGKILAKCSPETQTKIKSLL